MGLIVGNSYSRQVTEVLDGVLRVANAPRGGTCDMEVLELDHDQTLAEAWMRESAAEYPSSEERLYYVRDQSAAEQLCKLVIAVSSDLTITNNRAREFAKALMNEVYTNPLYESIRDHLCIKFMPLPTRRRCLTFAFPDN